MLVPAKGQRTRFGPCDYQVEIELRYLLGRVVINVVKAPAEEHVTGLDQVIDRYILRNRTRAPRLPAFDYYLDRFRLQDFADGVRLGQTDIHTKSILMLLNESE